MLPYFAISLDPMGKPRGAFILIILEHTFQIFFQANSDILTHLFDQLFASRK